MRRFLICTALFALAACNKPEPTSNEAAPAAEAGPKKGVDRSHRGKPIPDVNVLAPDGEETSLSDMRGPVLLNLWATWCAPCVKELPTLNALARSHDKAGALAVVAVSQDSGPQASVEAFMEKLGVIDLGVYQDPKMALSGALGPDTVLPTTILYDAQGKEVWRYVGDLDWTGAEAAKLLSEARGARPGG